MNNNSNIESIYYVLGMAIGTVLAILFLSTIVYFLWNLAIPQVFGLPEITWTQSIVIWLLFRVLTLQYVKKE